jgi:SAM-dependent methyltransferase
MNEVISRVRRAYARKGFWGFLAALGRWFYYYGITAPLRTFLHYFYSAFRRPRIPTFSFQGKSYEYFYHPYNFTWASERIVEIPIIWEAVRLAAGKRILEVGNVLNHYFDHNHDVLDKYEKWPNIINEDIIDFAPREKYDLIVSISTLEHVGWDTGVGEEKDPPKLLRAIANLVDSLAPGGRLIFTVPFGYNSFLDKCLKEGQIHFSQKYFLKRISKQNEWREVSYGEAQDTRYNHPFFAANAIVVGVMRREIL